MTDKQIIIDGVDVSGCSWYTQGATGMICADWHISNDCSKNPNCYYKQLKRSEAQCEGMFVSHTDLEKKYKAKEQECEELKKQLTAYIKEAEENFEVYTTLKDNYRKLYQTLTEIKEIARVGAFYWKHYKEESKRYNEILQKISECEVNDGN